MQSADNLQLGSGLDADAGLCTSQAVLLYFNCCCWIMRIFCFRGPAGVSVATAAYCRVPGGYTSRVLVQGAADV